MSTLQLNPEFDTTEFLARYWQKEPVLLRNLITDFDDLISPEELAGIACEEVVESRIVSTVGKLDWQLRNGPFSESVFTQLPEQNWTLLVQAVDQWVDELAELRTLFEFIPSWRIDDIMVSFAATGGGVGPHYDHYDVFLLQGTGQRRWSIGERCHSDSELISGTDLRLLKDFEAKQQFELSAGDALYVPARYAHWGVANSDSLCYSIGFRAPSMAEMLEGFSDFIIKRQDPAQRYVDGEITDFLRRGEILPGQLDASFQQMSAAMAEKEDFISWFGCYASQPKYPELIEALEHEFSTLEFQALLADGTPLQKNPLSRFAFIESTTRGSTLFFVDGSMAVFPIKLAAIIATLCEADEICREKHGEAFKHAELLELLRRLLNQGSLLSGD